MSESPDSIDTDDDLETGLAVIAHLGALFTSLLAPLLIYLLADDEFSKENAANALNWQIMCFVYSLISGVLIIVAVGFVLLPLVLLLNLVFCVIAAAKASNGEAWEYPLTPAILE